MDEKNDYSENEQREHEDSDDKEFDNIMEEKSDNNIKDLIHELFLRVFINNSWSYASQVEKPYYSARIYPNICIECKNLNIIKPAKGELSYCNSCNNNITISKKCLK